MVLNTVQKKTAEFMDITKPTDEVVENFIKFSTEDKGVYLEMVKFLMCLDRGSKRFSNITQIHLKAMENETYRKFRQNFIDDSKGEFFGQDAGFGRINDETIFE
jgi:hypothetical protein